MKKFARILSASMALLIIVISMTSISYSWFEPGEKAGIGLEFVDDTKLRAQSNCKVETYTGTKQNGEINYPDKVSEEITVDDNQTMYFKTIITNNSEVHDTVVSLYLPSFTPSDGSASLCVAVPTNSVRTFSAEQMDLHIIRNAYVPKLVATDANPGQLIVEWFVKCESGSVTFNPSQVYLMYS